MTTINVSEDYGNASKMKVPRDQNIAFAENDVEFILDTVADDIDWTVVGDAEIRALRPPAVRLKLTDYNHDEL